MARILVVDDQPSIARLIERALQIESHKTIMKENGAAALELLRTDQDFDLIITDYDMPQMNGLELAVAVRLDARLKNIPMIMASATTEADAIQKLLKKNVINRFLPKPFTLVALHQEVEILLNSTNTNLIAA